MPHTISKIEVAFKSKYSRIISFLFGHKYALPRHPKITHMKLRNDFFSLQNADKLVKRSAEFHRTDKSIR